MVSSVSRSGVISSDGRDNTFVRSETEPDRWCVGGVGRHPCWKDDMSQVNELGCKLKEYCQFQSW